MSIHGDVVSAVLRDPNRTTEFSLAHWDLLVRQARHANVLGHLAAVFEERGTLPGLPQRVRPHFANANTVASRHVLAVRWEVNRIAQALVACEVPVVLLKGAAYVLADLPPARGRFFNDVDIMVPKRALGAVELALSKQGWMAIHHDAYDQRYYRTWMHELPPLRHVMRRTILDVHHTILPPTAGLRLDPELLFAAAVPLKGVRGMQVLSPADMVLHSAAHLFFDGELDHGLRDLVDLDALLSRFSTDEAFWPTLARRARELDLERPFHYALRYAARFVGTTVPSEVLQATDGDRPGPVLQAWMDALFTRALAPAHPSCADRYTGLARWLLFMRSHYLRMPLYLLVPHLVRKALLDRAEPPA